MDVYDTYTYVLILKFSYWKSVWVIKRYNTVYIEKCCEWWSRHVFKMRCMNVLLDTYNHFVNNRDIYMGTKQGYCDLYDIYLILVSV